MSPEPGTARHREHAETLRSALAADAGRTAAALRTTVAAAAAGGPATTEPFDALARRIGTAAYRVTDDDVAAVRRATGSDKAAFEIVMSACVGAGLARWDAAIRAVEEATDATD